MTCVANFNSRFSGEIESPHFKFPPKGNLPWNYKNTVVDVALTGKAFRLLEKNKDKDMFAFKSVLAICLHQLDLTGELRHISHAFVV